MDFQRIILVAALTFTLVLMWQAWQEDYGQPKAVTEATTTDSVQLEDGAVEKREDMPRAPEEGGAAQSSDTPVVQQAKVAERIHVRTDVYDIELDTTGGDLRRVDLLNYPVSVDKPDQPVRLMDDGDKFYIAQAAMIASGESAAPSHHQQFRAEKSNYSLTEGEDSLEVRLSWSDETGSIHVDKIYTFHRGSYAIDVNFVVTNNSDRSWSGHVYRQLQRNEPSDSSSLFMPTYTGGVIYSQEEKYEKIKFEDMREQSLNRNIQGGWVAMIEHYFLSSWIPDQEETGNYYTKAPSGNRYILGMVSPSLTVAPGQTEETHSQLYVGPKLQEQLEEVAEGLELTVDYGLLTFISKPLFWMLDLIHSLIGNWGWAIIILTLLIKIAFYKLSETSYKSMAQMRKLQPRLQQLKERFGDDKQKMQEAMMKMYREEKVNPLSGCLPILVQIPVFIALYYMLLESVELRQAPFMFWIEDLSIKDPYYVLPVLMGLTMLIQHKLNPTPLDPIQARVMMILPIAFTFFFMFFPAGLVLYWVANNTLSIAQQYYITRVVIGDK
ncbi:MAG: membrane protein insertase YidC [Pseudomonadota bacterium]